MKSRNRLAFFSAVLILVASISMVAYLGGTTANAKPSYSFKLLAKGTAYDPHLHKWVNVALSVTGWANGKTGWKMEIDLYVKGYDAIVKNYPTFFISRGCGEVVNKCHYIALYLTLTAKYYGGKVALWCLSGRTGKLTSHTLSLSLYSEYLMLPISGKHVLKDLSLKGTLVI
jgi:hypothetical protein